MPRWIPTILVAVILAIAIRYTIARVYSGPQLALVDIRPGLKKSDEPSAGLCPWRNPERDRVQFFPSSTGYRDETLILTPMHSEIERKLGRPMTGDDNALQIHTVLKDGRPTGAIVTRRVRGECGLIELVLAIGTNGRVVGACVQREREMPSTAAFLNSPKWLESFQGKTAASPWQVGKDLPDPPQGALLSAEALARNAKTVLILYQAGSRMPPTLHSHDE
ncbi:MAG TPA: hypothetical protein VGS41_09065 [Chthonomonadales bacterium]|nr:hypothetical protein [Chthonomonadales bacterium]